VKVYGFILQDCSIGPNGLCDEYPLLGLIAKITKLKIPSRMMSIIKKVN